MPEPTVSPIAIYQLRVVLLSPLIWRRLLVVSETSLGELHEILQSAVVFLASDDSSFVAGAELVVDGGMIAV